MTTGEPDHPEGWQNNLNQRLLRRFITPLFQPGVIRPSLGGSILGRVQRMTRQLPLLDSVSRRSAAVESDMPHLPVVAAQPAPPRAETATGGLPAIQLPASATPSTGPAASLPTAPETHTGQTSAADRRAPGDPATAAESHPIHGAERASELPTPGLPLARANLPPQTLPRATQSEGGGSPSAAARAPAESLSPAARPEPPRGEAPLPVVRAQRMTATALPALPRSAPGTSPPAQAAPLPVTAGAAPRTTGQAGAAAQNPVLPVVHVQRMPLGASGEGLPVVSAAPVGLNGYRGLPMPAPTGPAAAPRPALGREAAPDMARPNNPALPSRRSAPGGASPAAPAALIQRVGEETTAPTAQQVNPPGITTTVESAAQAAASGQGEVDVDELADKVMRKIAAEMKIERERRGW